MKDEITHEVIEAKIAKLSEDRKILVTKTSKLRSAIIDIETDIAYLEQLISRIKNEQ